MAFRLAYTDPDTHAVYPNAFWQIIGGTGDLNGNYIEARVAIFADVVAATQGAKPIRINAIPFTPADLATQITIGFGPSIFREVVLAAMYAVLKARAEFSGAVDVE